MQESTRTKPTMPSIQLTLPTERVANIAEDTLKKIGSLLLPGYFLLHRLPSTGSKLRLLSAWGLRISTEVGSGFAYGSITSLFSSAFMGSVASVGLFGLMAFLPSILTYAKGFLMRRICDIPELEAQYASSLTRDVFHALRLRPNTDHRPIVQKLKTLSRKVSLQVSSQLHSSYANSIAPTVLACASGGAYTRAAVLSIFFLKAALSFADKRAPNALYDFLDYMTGVNDMSRNLEKRDHMGERTSFSLDNTCQSLTNTICQRQKASWYEYIATTPLTAVATAVIRIIEMLLKGLTHFPKQQLSEFLTNFSMQYMNAGSIYNTIRGGKDLFKAKEDIDFLEAFVADTKKHCVTIDPPAHYYVGEKNLVLQSVSYTFKADTGNKCLYRDVSITFRPGIYWLTGRNGTGKSTFMGMIAGEIRPDRGSISLGTAETFRLSPSARDKVTTWGPQDFHYHEKRSVLFNILFRLGEELFSEGRLKLATNCKTAASLKEKFRRFSIIRRINTAATTLGIPALLEKDSPRGLSGGEKKLLMLLIVMLRSKYIESSKVIMLDEITAGMDDQKIETVKKVLTGRYFKNRIVLVTTHEAGIFAGKNPVPFDQRYEIADQTIRAIP